MENILMIGMVKMNKLVITQEQETALNTFITDGHTLEDFIKSRGDFEQEYEPLNDFSPEQFSFLLNGYYKLENVYKVGQWVTDANNDTWKVHAVLGGKYIPDFDAELYDSGQFTKVTYFTKSEISKATASEIDQEKTRRFWIIELGRDEIGQLKCGDVVYDSTNGLHECGEDHVDAGATIVCPYDKRLD